MGSAAAFRQIGCDSNGEALRRLMCIGDALLKNIPVELDTFVALDKNKRSHDVRLPAVPSFRPHETVEFTLVPKTLQRLDELRLALQERYRMNAPPSQEAAALWLLHLFQRLEDYILGTHIKLRINEEKFFVIL